MINMFNALVEAADSSDFTLKSIDPRDKAYNESEDNEFVKEAYTKACIAMELMRKETHDKLKEILINIGDDANKLKNRINTYSERRINTSIHQISLNPRLIDNFHDNLEKTFITTNDITPATVEKDLVDRAVLAFKERFTPLHGALGGKLTLENAIGEILKSDVSIKLIIVNMNQIGQQISHLIDETFFCNRFLIQKIEESKNPSDIELFTRMYEIVTRIINFNASVYVSSFMELYRIGSSIINPTAMTEAAGATNEENAKQYINEMDKLIDDIRDFYDDFEYKEVLTPRKKREHKMYEYMLGALQRKYTLKVPMYKVVGSSKDVKEIVEEKFIKKLESITNKYPNFCIMSPSWDEDDDMFIYVTLREPFGEKDDRKDRESQTKSMNEAAMTAAERKTLDNSEFGLPSKRKYPLNDETHIREAIKFFGYCNPEDKSMLAANIVKATLKQDLFGVVYVSEKHPNKKFFPEWFAGNCKSRGYTLSKRGNKYTIKDAEGKKLDWYTITDTKPMNESILFDSEGRLF